MRHLLKAVPAQESLVMMWAFMVLLGVDSWARFRCFGLVAFPMPGGQNAVRVVSTFKTISLEWFRMV